MSPSQTHRILLVEDDEMHAELISRAFEDSPQMALTIAHRLDEARAILHEQMPDMVIADLRLPDGRGIELCRGKDFPIVIMTSQGSEADAVEAMRAGALDYIVKSDVMFNDMPHVVERGLREWGLLRAHARADRQLQSQYEIASALAVSSTIKEAGPRILESICRCVDWPVGELWRVDDDDEHIRREAFFALKPEYQRIADKEADAVFSRGEGLPGATWDAGGAHAVSYPPERAHQRRRAFIGELDLHCGYGFPLHTHDDRTFALLTFYAEDIGTPNGDIERLLGTVSAQLNLFVERQRAEEERRRLQQELVERERLAAVGETAATLAHEIGNPLNSMYLHSQLLQRRLARLPEVDPKLTQGVELLLSENLRLADLLQDFRSLSRRHALALAPVDIGTVLDQLLTLQQPAQGTGSVEIIRQLRPDLPSISGDEAKLRQVFMNLIKNAFEAMPDGGRLTVRADVEDDRLIVEIMDTGGGLPEGIDVFEPFQTTKAFGTGLGLPVARQILTAHEATIDCRSTSGEGTTFRIVFSVQRDA